MRLARLTPPDRAEIRPRAAGFSVAAAFCLRPGSTRARLSIIAGSYVAQE
jgi:hypothetical protein